MTINSINHSQKQQEEVCFYDGVPPIHVPPKTMTLQQIAENFFCAYFFGALSSTEDLPLDFESEDVQMNSQTRMRTVATTNFHFYSFSLFKGLWYYRPVPSAAKVNCSYVSWPFRSKGGWGEVGERRRYHCFLGSVIYYPPTFLPRTSTSFGFCKPRVVTLSNVVPSADCQCVTRQALSYGLLVCL